MDSVTRANAQSCTETVPGCSCLLPGAGFNMIMHFHCPHKLNRCTKAGVQSFAESFTGEIESPPSVLRRGITIGGGAYSGREGGAGFDQPRVNNPNLVSTGFSPLQVQ